MLLFGKFENKNYVDKKFTFKLDFDFNSPWFIEFNNKNLSLEKNSCVDGFYHLEIEKNGKLISEIEGNCIGELHPIEILHLIDSNKNWSIKLDEIFANNSRDILPIINTTDVVLSEHFDINNIDVFDDKYLEYFKDYNQDFLNAICKNSSSFSDSWLELELKFNSPDFDVDDDLITDYTKDFVKHVILKNDCQV